MEPVKIQVVPAPWMIENAISKAANLIEYRDKIPGLYRFVRWERDSMGSVAVYLAPTELAEPPALSGDQILEIQDAVDHVHTPKALVLSVLECTEEELSSFLALSFHFNSNPLPALRARFAEVNIDVDIRADHCGDAVTIRFE